MIPKHVVRQFLERELNDYRSYAKMSAERLLALRKQLPTRPPIWNALKKHQRMMLILGAVTKRFAFHADTGTGKTFLSVALVRYFRKLDQVSQVLVLVPNKTNKYEWSRNVKKHSPATKVCALTGSSIKKWEQFNETDAAIIVETYAGLMRMVCTMVPSKRKGKKHKLKPSLKLIQQLCKKVNGLILDESTLVKTKSKLPFRITRQISKRSQIVFALTGTPFGKDPVDLWAQFFLVDGGETLGPTLGLFRSVFFTEQQGYWGGTTYTFKSSMKNELHRTIANRSISVPANAADLPKVMTVPIYVRLPKDAGEYAQQAKSAVIKAHGNYQEMRNAFLRTRQISSGYLGYVDDELGEKAQYQFPTNPKLEALVAKVQEITNKIIIFHEYTFSGDLIAAELKRIGVKFVRVYGKTKDPGTLLHQFDHDASTQVLLLNNAAGGFGLNLQVAKYGMVYESPVSPIMRKQVLARFIRQHSKHGTVFLYDFICRGTYDQRILDAIAAGRDLFESIIQGKGNAK